MIGYIILIFSALIYGIGSPSKTGRRGEWAYQISSIGFLGLLIGSVLIGLNDSLQTGIISFILGFIGAIFINRLKQ